MRTLAVQLKPVMAQRVVKIEQMMPLKELKAHLEGIGQAQFSITGDRTISPFIWIYYPIGMELGIPRIRTIHWYADQQAKLF